jgi:hypothetical protein
MDGPVRPWKTPTLGDLLRLAWPVVIGRAAQSVVGFTDAAFVASLGPDALAAASNGGMNALAVYMLPTGIVFIIQSFAAQLHGAGDVSALRRYAWYGLALAAAAQLMALAAIPMVPWALASLGYSPAVRALMAADAMTIPARVDEAGVARAAQPGPVFSVDADGALHMRYTARTRSIAWRDDDATRNAVDMLAQLLAGRWCEAASWMLHLRLGAGMGLVCHNVLHERSAFADDPAAPRLLYRARYLDRVAGSTAAPTASATAASASPRAVPG